MRVTKAALTVCWFVCGASAFAQSPEKEPAAIVEVGGAGNWRVKGGGSAFGPAVAVEVTAIKNWLELEAGVTPLFAKCSTEWDTDLLFKKPVGHFQENGVYVGRWSSMGSHEQARRDQELD